MESSMQALAKLRESLLSGRQAQAGIKIIYLGGSVAREQADSSSDIDICILWSEIPPKESRELFYRKIGANCILSMEDSEVGEIVENVSDQFEFLGIKVDVNSLLLNNVILISQGAQRLLDISFDLHELFYALSTAVPLFGEELLREIKSNLKGPNDNQKFSGIQRLLKREWPVSLRKYFSRQDWPAFHLTLVTAYRDLYLSACLAENFYYPGIKRHFLHKLNFKNSWISILDNFWQASPLEQIERVELSIQNFREYLERGMA
jgi:predicted nucleotidyltransferase